jgi:hypothetical protein
MDGPQIAKLLADSAAREESRKRQGTDRFFIDPGRPEPLSSEVVDFASDAQPTPPHLMRYWRQPRWADGPFDRLGGERVRRTPKYDEVELLREEDGNHYIAVVYLIQPDPNSFYAATCFEGRFDREFRALIDAPENRLPQVISQIVQRTPVAGDAIIRGLKSDFSAPALVTLTDPNDGALRYFLASYCGNRRPGSSPFDDRGRRVVETLLTESRDLGIESSPFTKFLSGLDSQHLLQPTEPPLGFEPPTDGRPNAAWDIAKDIVKGLAVAAQWARIIGF